MRYIRLGAQALAIALGAGGGGGGGSNVYDTGVYNTAVYA